MRDIRIGRRSSRRATPTRATISAGSRPWPAARRAGRRDRELPRMLHLRLYVSSNAVARRDRSLAEPVPDGPSTQRLVAISKKLGVAILAGLIERDGDKLFKCHVAVSPEGFVAKFHKLHPFINPAISWGEGHRVFDLCGIRCGILICYDNNLPENPRITAMMGAEVIFAPHVTCGLPSPMPGRGKIDKKLWDNRERDPVPLRMEFQGPKGRGWLMRWLPARAFREWGLLRLLQQCRR